jgi:hypothetical protein
MTAFETYAGITVATLSLVDQFAQERGTRGLMPGPIPPLRFSLVARQEQFVMTPLDPPITLYGQSGFSGAYVFDDEGRFGESPRYRIVPGRYTLRIESDYYETLNTDVDWPATPATLPPLLLRPANAYPFPDVTLTSTRLTLMRGAVMGIGSRAPVADARVKAIDPPELSGSFASSVTDARGSWVLAFRVEDPSPVQATVRVTLPDNSTFDVANITILPNADNSVSQTALRGAVLTPGGNPIPNSEITVDAVPNVSVRSGRDGNWAFYLGLNQPNGAAVVTAQAPNGQSEAQNVQIRNRATVVVPSFRIAMN